MLGDGVFASTTARLLLTDVEVSTLRSRVEKSWC